MTVWLALAACLGALFDVTRIPLSSSDARVLAAPCDNDNTADLVVYGRTTLDVFFTRRASSETTRTPDHSTIELPDNSSAFDIADIDKDGKSEVVFVQGRRILKCPVPPATGTGKPLLLFEADTLFSNMQTGIFPHVMAVPYEGRTLLVLPTQDALEMRTPDGELAAIIPIERRRRMSFEPAAEGDGASLPFNLWQRIDWEIAAGEHGLPVEQQNTTRFGGAPSMAYGAEDSPADEWPWFLVSETPALRIQAYYAIPESGAQATIVRVASLSTHQDKNGREKTDFDVGPPRRYPGTNTLPSSDILPDFNGDNAADLILWSSPLPGISIGALTRAVVGGTWPVRITAHLFSPTTRRFAPQPSSAIETRVPVRWFVEMESGTPLRNALAKDFNGDGKTDWACSTSENRFSVWLHETTFSAEPDFSIETPEAILKVQFAADLDGRRCTSVVLRTPSALYLLYAPPEDVPLTP